MDSTQIYFSMQVDIAEFSDSAIISMPAPELDLSASIFLPADNANCGVCSVFFTLHASLENAMFHVHEGFEKLIISVKADIRKFFSKVRSMWRERVKLNCFRKILKVPAFTVMRT